jgi:amino acid transporter
MASLIVGIVVGTAIFRAPPTVFGQFDSPWLGLSVWFLGGLLAFCGALCYSELGAAYPDFGAEYVYLGRAYGRRIAFLFAWMQLCVVLTSSIGAMSFVFVDYLNRIVPLPSWSHAFVAIGAVFTLLCLQIAGLRVGKFVQNLLTASKLLALIALLLAGFSQARHPEAFSSAAQQEPTSFSLALILVMFAYAGWNDATAVAPEVREPQRNLPRALLYGLGFVVLLYMLVNAAYLNVLGLPAVRSSTAPAADLIGVVFGSQYAWIMSAMIVVSSLGAIHGTMIAASRLLNAVGHDYPAFSAWRVWNARGAPAWALITVFSISSVLTLLAGTRVGFGLLQFVARPLGLTGEFDPEQGFDVLVSSASPVFFLFFAMAGFGLIVLRQTDPDRPRPFRVPGYPFTPLALTAIAGFMCYSGLQYIRLLVLLSAPPLFVGVVLAFLLRPAANPFAVPPPGGPR